MKRIQLTVAVLAATFFLAYLAGHRPRVSAARGQKGSEASAASSVPDFTLKNLEGRDESLGQFTGTRPSTSAAIVGDSGAGARQLASSRNQCRICGSSSTSTA